MARPLMGKKIMLEETFLRGWENFIARTSGPMRFRFLLQPTVAAFFAIRAGLADARQRRPAFFWSLVTNSEHRRQLLRQGWKDCGKVFLIAVVLDSIYQLIVHHGIYTLETVFTATILAVVPYLLLRGPVNRMAKWRERKEA